VFRTAQTPPSSLPSQGAIVTGGFVEDGDEFLELERYGWGGTCKNPACRAHKRRAISDVEILFQGGKDAEVVRNAARDRHAALCPACKQPLDVDVSSHASFFSFLCLSLGTGPVPRLDGHIPI
jgi:hypothetical protein